MGPHCLLIKIIKVQHYIFLQAHNSKYQNVEFTNFLRKMSKKFLKDRGIDTNFCQCLARLRNQRVRCEGQNCSNWRKLIVALSLLFTDESSNISSFVPHSSMLNSRQLIYTYVHIFVVSVKTEFCENMPNI